ncbi:MAG: DNA primase [Nanoarchaeota archaeon]
MFKQSSLKDREKFYKKEFDLKKVASWLKKLPYKPQFFVIDAGSETKIIKDKNKLKKLIFFKPYMNLKELKKKLIKHLPEDVYYDRNIYKNPWKCLKNFNFKNAPYSKNFFGQELAFDVDPENINCPSCGKKFFPKFCKVCSKMTIEDGYKIYKELKKKFNKVEIVYSGRGCHVHVLDKKAYKLGLDERKKLNNKFKKYAIDPWVSYGRIRLIKLPYSLNTLSSRIVTPLKIKEISKFNPDEKKFIPKFLK